VRDKFVGCRLAETRSTLSSDEIIHIKRVRATVSNVSSHLLDIIFMCGWFSLMLIGAICHDMTCYFLTNDSNIIKEYLVHFLIVLIPYDEYKIKSR